MPAPFSDTSWSARSPLKDLRACTDDKTSSNEQKKADLEMLSNEASMIVKGMC
jgi:hypothetical protein